MLLHKNSKRIISTGLDDAIIKKKMRQNDWKWCRNYSRPSVALQDNLPEGTIIICTVKCYFHQ